MKYLKSIFEYLDLTSDNYDNRLVDNFKGWDIKDFDSLVTAIADKLGYKSPKYVSKGSQGIVYNVDDDTKVLKLTADFNEAENAYYLSKKVTKHIANYYDVRKLQLSDKKLIEDIYVIVLDRVIPCEPNSLEAKICGFLEALKFRTLPYSNLIRGKESILEKTIEYCEKKFAGSPNSFSIDKVKSIVDSFYAILKECEEKNISNGELHSGNIGYKDGVLMYFDVGVYSSDTNKGYDYFMSKIKTILI